MNEKQMSGFSNWYDGMLNESEIEIFNQARALDPAYNQECKDMEEMLSALAFIDNELQPSPQFHSNLMERLTKELAETEEIKVNPSKKGVEFMGKKAGIKGSFQKFIKNLKNKNLKVLLPVTAGACALVLVVSLGMDGFIPKRFNLSTDDSAQSSSSMNMEKAEIFQYDMDMNQADAGFTKGDEALRNDLKFKSNINPILPPEETGSVAPDEQEQKIIYNGNMGLEVVSFDQTLATIKETVQNMGGYVVSEQRYNLDDKGRMAGDISLRIPYNQFAILMSQAGELGKILNQSTSARDVTTEFVDVQARIKVMEAKEARLMELLGQTGSLTDVLAVEQELANTRGDLESLKGQLRYLSNQTDYSTLNINIQEKPKEASQIKVNGLTGLWLRIKEAFILGINSLFSNMADLIVLVVRIIPTLIIGALIIWFIWIKWLKNWWLNRKS